MYLYEGFITMEQFIVICGYFCWKIVQGSWLFKEGYQTFWCGITSLISLPYSPFPGIACGLIAVKVGLGRWCYGELTPSSLAVFGELWDSVPLGAAWCTSWLCGGPTGIWVIVKLSGYHLIGESVGNRKL